MQSSSFFFSKMTICIAIVEISPDSSMNLRFKTEKQEIIILNYSDALWNCFGFHIAQVGNILVNQATLPNLAIGLDLWNDYPLLKKVSSKIKWNST